MEAMLDEETKSPKGVEDVHVDVNEFTRSSDIRMAGKEDPDETEYSSSFANSMSGNENCSGLSDAEAESKFYGDDNFASAFDGYSSVFPIRKKKVTSHWRSFIRPLMWRCKWTELRIKQFDSQASKYDREISTHETRKHLAVDQFTLKECGSRSLPFTFQSERKKAMKRRKRKRVEETTDITSYMAHHNLFSYCENKRSDLDGTSIPDDFDNQVSTEQNTTVIDDFGNNDDLTFLQDNDNFLEQILQKIEIVHSRVHKLKAQLDLVMSKNAGKFSSSENLSYLVPCDAQTSSVRGPTFSANADTMSMGGLCIPAQHVPEYDIGDLVIPESAISGYGDAVSIPDITESTVGLLSYVDVTQHEPQIGESCENIVDNILIHNQEAELERHISEKNQDQVIEKHTELEKSVDEESTNLLFSASEPDPISICNMSQGQSALKSHLTSDFHFPTNKRKRGERKASSGGWSRQCPGEPESL